MALNRAPAPPTSFVRGKAGYIPYMPGGLEDVLGNEQEQKRSQNAASKSGLRSIPPGFERGFQVTDQVNDGDLQDLAKAIDLGTLNVGDSLFPYSVSLIFVHREKRNPCIAHQSRRQPEVLVWMRLARLMAFSQHQSVGRHPSWP